MIKHVLNLVTFVYTKHFKYNTKVAFAVTALMQWLLLQHILQTEKDDTAFFPRSHRTE